MANLRDIQKRINSVNSTKQITRTMEMVSAAKIRRVTERVEQMTPFSDALTEAIFRIGKKATLALHPMLGEHKDHKNAIIIAITSDRGLAGAFSTSVLKEAEKLAARVRSEGLSVDYIACGKKAISYFKYRGIETLAEYKDLSADPTREQGHEITELCASRYIERKTDRVYLVYNHAKNAADQVLTALCVLPITEQSLYFTSAFDEEQELANKGVAKKAAENQNSKKGEAKGGPVISEYVYEPDMDKVLEGLLPTYLRVQIFHSLVDSAAAEQGARRKAMKAATDNATEMVDNLTRIYNRVRQGAITTEITEIVGGAAALED